ncbi:MAG: hypothetical protein GF409_02590 [Candidatus Omnitrophica bacterium]|nr:hypothetical protein [Candidatus Omnitrophota bacterium]
MKKIAVLAIIVVFALGTVSAFAGEGQKGKPMSKSYDDGTFQAAAEHISHWGKSQEIVKDESLRDKEAELEKRRKGKNAIGII